MADSGTRGPRSGGGGGGARSRGYDVKLSGPGRFMPGGVRGSGRCAVHTSVHDDRFAFGFEGECANILAQVKPYKAHTLGVVQRKTTESIS
ncbi:hypothetical protein GQ55_9G479400 [Panicum hallii var. hallii]|uniref:Uncharacterized protein n=1 Tax=Panicum hallii var. hallii TaxID=1504633 RepID=A0A2T7CCT3_9POAL|nr:hypothetical protein GQ55_9G479400 [Panicum hallii var. hallii]